MSGECAVAYWMERLDEHYEYLQPTVPLIKKPPSEYMRKLMGENAARLYGL